jgi:4-hydroxy-2-oxoheptanedioate aldolase
MGRVLPFGKEFSKEKIVLEVDQMIEMKPMMERKRAKRKNMLRELLKADKPSLGTHLLGSWPGLVEVIGQTGAIDYIEFVGEYAPYDLYSLENFGRAINLFDHMSSMMKIDQEPRLYLACRAIGSGIQNLLFADIRTVEDVKQCVAAVRAETPKTGGLNGVGMRRDVGYVMAPGSKTYVEQLEDSVVALMIEKQSALEHLEEILSVKGVDMVQFGPADYSMSIGIPGQWSDPKVKEAERYTIETALRKGVAPRVELMDFKDAKPYLKMGIKHFCIGWDVEVLYRYCMDQGMAFQTYFRRD